MAMAPSRGCRSPAAGAFAITDATPVAYRKIVDIEKCNDCHLEVTLHGNSRTGNAELCATCHNPNATDINRRVAGSNCESVTGTLDDQTIDFKVMIHAIHAGSLAGYKVCGFGNTGYDFSNVRYPGRLNNCEGCHLPDTYYPPAATALATTFDAGLIARRRSATSRSRPPARLLLVPQRRRGEAAHGVEWCLVQCGQGRQQRDAGRTGRDLRRLPRQGHRPATWPAHGVGQFLYND